MDGFFERLLDRLEEMNLIRADLCRALGISEGTVRNWKKGVMPAADTALKIADYLQVSVSWLVSGQGEKLQHSYREMSESISDSERELLELYRNLSDEDKERLIDIAETFRKKTATFISGNVRKFVRDC